MRWPGWLDGFLDLASDSWLAITRHRLRSLLSVAGVVIGVAAVVALMGIGNGVRLVVTEHFAQLGSGLLVVMSGSSKGGGIFGGAATQPTLTWADLRAIRREVPEVAVAVPSARLSAQVVSADSNWSTTIQGSEPAIMQVSNWTVSHGEPFNDSDLASRARVALVGTTVAEKLFPPGVDPLGSAIRIRGTPFNVIGLLARKGQGGPGRDQDDVILIPLTSHLAFLGTSGGSAGPWLPGDISVTANGEPALAQAAITRLLRERHRLSDETVDDFQVMNVAQVVSAATGAITAMSLLLSATAAISLFVGGIGVMNTLLASIAERTRELGLRLALGAAPRDLLLLVLAEALVLSVLGGALGAGVGLLVTWLASLLTGWQCTIGAGALSVAVGVAGLTGILAGMFPAVRAARMDPIDALRGG